MIYELRKRAVFKYGKCEAQEIAQYVQGGNVLSLFFVMGTLTALHGLSKGGFDPKTA